MNETNNYRRFLPTSFTNALPVIMDCCTATAVAVAAGALPTAGAGKSEAAEFVDSKTSFGDKQKPLYHMPLKWRKLVGKPQVPWV